MIAKDRSDDPPDDLPDDRPDDRLDDQPHDRPDDRLTIALTIALTITLTIVLTIGLKLQLLFFRACTCTLYMYNMNTLPKSVNNNNVAGGVPMACYSYGIIGLPLDFTSSLQLMNW